MAVYVCMWRKATFYAQNCVNVDFQEKNLEGH